ncbi:MAG: sortase [Clostridia bacterium]|nr:sortase [Clostridium sp.]
MNQILVTKKLYITPELKKKKKIYKFNFILSLFFLIVLVSFYIYAAYDREKSEAVSQEILANANIPEEDKTEVNSDILIAVLNDTTDDGKEEKPVVVPTTNSSNTVATKPKEKSSAGYTYVVDGRIEIPKIKVDYPILSGETKSEQETEALLKMSPLKFHGPEINEVGNYCIVGHNYRNSKFFSKVPTLENGDIIKITDTTGKVVEYSVYTKYNVVPSDTTCTDQRTNGKKEITLITCTNDSKERVIVKARAI